MPSQNSKALRKSNSFHFLLRFRGCAITVTTSMGETVMLTPAHTPIDWCMQKENARTAISMTTTRKSVD